MTLAGARIAVAGGSPLALALAVRAQAAGFDTVLIEGDPHDAQRSFDLLARAGVTLRVALGAPVADVVIDASGTGAHPAAGAAQHLSLAVGLPGPGRAVIDLSVPDLALAEVLEGSDPRALDVLARLGIPALCVPVFIAAPLIAALEDAAEALVFDGSTPWEVDAVAEGAGFTLGPCAAQDLRGLDRAFARHKAQGSAMPLIGRMVPEGRLGRAGGVGWYRYPGGGGRVIDPLIEDLAREEAYFAGHAVRAISPQDIRDRLLGALATAARRLGADPALTARIVALAFGLTLTEGSHG